MKTLLSTILLCLVLVAQGCKNDDDLQDPIDRLPEATQTGAQTMGCLIDGEAWVSPSFGNGRPSAFYQFIDGAYTLGISGSVGGGDSLNYMSLVTIDNPNIIESSTNYTLMSNEITNYFAEIFSRPNELITETTSQIPGVLKITRFDDSIISGTFEFTVLDNDGNEIHITDGRFDLNYTN